MLKVAKMFVNPYDKGGKMVAFADVMFSLTEGGDGVMTVRGCKIFRDDNGSFNLALPSRKDEKDPSKYYPVISVDREKKDGQEFISYLNEEATKAYNAKVRSGGGDKPKKTNPKPTNTNTKADSLDDADLLF